MKRKIAAAACFGVLSIAVSISTEARERDVEKIGQWRVGVVEESKKSKFVRCFAENRSRSGLLRISLFPNGNYTLSAPCFGKVDIDGDIPFSMGGENGTIRLNADRQGSSCRTSASDLNEAWVAALRDDGELILAFGHYKPSWPLDGTKAAMAALKSCVAKNKEAVPEKKRKR
jgi:hypothetical protein